MNIVFILLHLPHEFNSSSPYILNLNIRNTNGRTKENTAVVYKFDT